MPQIAYTENPPEHTHLVLGVGMPASVTLCGRAAARFGQVIPSAPKEWPTPDAPWCADCERAYLGE